MKVLGHYCASESDRLALAQLPETAGGQALVRALARESQRVMRQMEDPRISDRFRDDVRFHMGEMDGLGFLRRVVWAARREAGLPAPSRPWGPGEGGAGGSAAAAGESKPEGADTD